MTRPLIDPNIFHQGGPSNTTAIVTDPNNPFITQTIANVNEHAAAIDKLEAGVSVTAARRLEVSPTLPAEANPLVYFTTIAAAMTQANTLTPTSTNPVVVKQASATYGESLVTLISNTASVGDAPGVVNLTNGVSWLAGQASNVGQIAGTENVALTNVFCSGSSVFDSTSKTGSSTSKITTTGSQFNFVTFTARGVSGQDLMVHNGTTFSNGTANTGLVVTNYNQSGASGGALFVGCRLHGCTFAGSTVGRIEGGEFVSANANVVVVKDTANLTISGVTGSANITATVAAGCKLKISGAWDTAITGAGDVDMRGADFGANTDITGITGTCNRSKWTQNATATAGGAGQTLTIVPTFPDQTGTISLQLISGPGNAAATAAWHTGATGTQVDITDSTNGNVWQVTILV